MKSAQRTLGLMAAGAALVGLALWLGGVFHGGAQSGTKAPAGTNAPALGPRARPGAPTTPAQAAARGAPRSGPATNPAAEAAAARLRSAQGAKPGARPGLNAGPGTNAPVLTARPGLKGSLVAKGAAPAPAAAPAKAKTGSQLLETLRRWQAKPSFYPMLSGLTFGTILGALLLVRYFKARQAGVVPAGTPSSMAVRMARRKTSAAAVASCNVLQIGAQGRQLWHFNARGSSFALNRQAALAPGQPLPGLIAKDWRSLFQRKLNIAWLPANQVFVRVAQFPVSDYTETVAMVELQLEKLSPIPINQIAWSIYVLPQVRESQQTIIVLIAARNVVEEFLGQLEGQGFAADRLEMPSLDQLQATPVSEDGVWIYPNAAAGAVSTALAAWWYGGTLQNLGFITLPSTNRAEGLREQLLQIAWAGEMEGWLTAKPRWHLVADEAAAAEWEPILRAGLEQPIEVSAPVPPLDLAAMTATRATQSEAQANLLPVEYATRYQQQFTDRLWMGGLGAVGAIYILGVVIYLVALQVNLMRTHGVEDAVTELAPAYTNALQIRARYGVLKVHEELTYAALDCWKAVAELLPESVTLDGFNFNEGKRLSLNGSAPADQQKELIQLEAAMRKYTKDGQLLFDSSSRSGEGLSFTAMMGVNRQTANWNLALELKRVEAQ